MSQTWIPNTSGELDSDDTLSASRGYINDALEALRSSFSGSSAPSSPVAGQFFLDTDDNLLYIYNGASWTVVGDADLNYLGTLARQGGTSYAMGGDLYMGTHQIKGVSEPTLSTDAATKNYVDTSSALLSGFTMAGDITMGANNITMDHNPTLATHLARKSYVDLFDPLAGSTWTGDHNAGSNTLTGLKTPSAASDAATKSYIDGKLDVSTGHDHDASDSKRVLWANLDTSGATVGQILTTDGAGAAVLRGNGAVAGYDVNANLPIGSYVTVVTSAAMSLVDGAKVAVIASWHQTGSALFKLQRIVNDTAQTATDIIAGTAFYNNYGGGFSYIDTISGADSYMYRIVGNGYTNLRDVYGAIILAVEVT